MRLSLPSRRKRTALSVRPADSADRDSIADLISKARWKHQHLDWADALGLIGQQPFLTAFEAKRLIAVLAFPPDPPGVAWLRLFAVARGHSPGAVWQSTWGQASLAAAQSGIESLAVLDIGGWLQPILQASGFQQTNEVMFMEWTGSRPPEPPQPLEGLRELEERDLPSLALLDRRAFGPIWRHSQRMLSLATQQASLANVVEREGQPIAYQISTATAFGAHLARLAVDPMWQDRGIGTGLVIDVLNQFVRQGFTRITLNTQADNLRSLRLYNRLGFSETGQRFPVYEAKLQLPTSPAIHLRRDPKE